LILDDKYDLRLVGRFDFDYSYERCHPEVGSFTIEIELTISVPTLNNLVLERISLHVYGSAHIPDQGRSWHRLSGDELYITLSITKYCVLGHHAYDSLVG